MTSQKENAGRQPGVDTAQTSNNSSKYESIKAILQSGRDVRVLDLPPALRPVVVGAIAKLRDELPIQASWQTIRESHLSETRLRVPRYFIPGKHLHEDANHAL